MGRDGKSKASPPPQADRAGVRGGAEAANPSYLYVSVVGGLEGLVHG